MGPLAHQCLERGLQLELLPNHRHRLLRVLHHVVADAARPKHVQHRPASTAPLSTTTIEVSNLGHQSNDGERSSRPPGWGLQSDIYNHSRDQSRTAMDNGHCDIYILSPRHGHRGVPPLDATSVGKHKQVPSAELAWAWLLARDIVPENKKMHGTIRQVGVI